MRIGLQGCYWSPPGSTGTFANAVNREIFDEEGELQDTANLDVTSWITSNEGGQDEGTNSVPNAMIKEEESVEFREENPTIIQLNNRLPKENGMQQHSHGYGTQSALKVHVLIGKDSLAKDKACMQPQ